MRFTVLIASTTSALDGCMGTRTRSAQPDREVVKANLPVMAARLNHAVALQEMSFTGTPPTVGTAGSQATAFLDEITHLGALPEPKEIVKLAS